jgi:cytoskeletal protein RodZ
MNATKLLVSTAAAFATIGAMGAIGVASAQSTYNTPSAAPVPSTSKATDPNREAQQRTNKPGTASPADASPVNRPISGMNDGAASAMDKSNTGRVTSTAPNTTDNSSMGTTMNATPNATDNTSTMNKNNSGSMERSTNMNDTTGMRAERAPRADRN